MKKILLTFFFASFVTVTNAQIIHSDNFETLTLGNLGTDVTGNTAGQNSWYTLNGSNASFQVANVDAAHGKSLSIIGNDTFDTANPSVQNSRIAAKISATTPTPSVGNNILQGKFDLFTGAPSGGAGQIQMRVWGVDGTTARTIGGFLYNVSTGVLTGLATVNNTGTGTQGPTTYSWALAAAPGLVLTANTWVTLEFRYNMTTGAFTFFHPSGSGNVAGGATYSLIPGMIAEDLYLYNIATTGNTASKTVSFDNIMIQFSNATALSTIELSTKKENLTIFPNPASDVLNIRSVAKIRSVDVFDLSGKKVSVRHNGNTVDIRSLQNGTYLLTVETANGSFTEKFIKK